MGTYVRHRRHPRIGAAAIVVVTVCMTGIAAADEVGRVARPHLLLDVGAGYLLPFGSWSRHAYESTQAGADVAQFSAGPNVSLMVGAAGLFGGPWELALRGDHTWLGTGQWESFAAANGDRVVADASMLSFGIQMGRDLRWAFGFPSVVFAGPAVFFPEGREEFTDIARSYHYSFLRTSWALRAGFGVPWRVASFVVLALTAEAVAGTPIVDYPGGEGRFLLAATFGLRVRLEDAR